MFDNNKEYTISEAAKIIGFSNHVLRYYEKEFEIEVPRNKAGHRCYTYLELKKFLYIKNLKERGMSNQQIKTILLKAPEQVICSDEVVATCNEEALTNGLYEIKKIISKGIDDSFKILTQNLMEEVQTVLEEIKKDNVEYQNNDKDALISENARLRMKLKEKSYELAMLREKVKRLENGKKPIFVRIFGSKKD